MHDPPWEQGGGHAAIRVKHLVLGEGHAGLSSAPRTLEQYQVTLARGAPEAGSTGAAERRAGG